MRESLDARFSLVVGGPFHALLGRLGLLGPDLLPTATAAVGLAALAWGLPALAALFQTLADSGDLAGYLAAPSVPARYLVAITVLVLAERHAETRIAGIVDGFRRSGLLEGGARPQFDAALHLADRRSSSAFAEAVLLLVALGWSAFIAHQNIAIRGGGWDGRLADGAVVLSWAGQAARAVSTPLFLFLTLRWGWRFCVWSLLLRAIARLPLQLSALHPDRCGGIGFLSLFPGVFRGVVFALGCVVAALLIGEPQVMERGAGSWQAVALIWMTLVVALLVAPLLVFNEPLYRLRERELLVYGSLVNRSLQALHRRWVLGEPPPPDRDGTPDLGELALALENVRGTRTVPVDRTVVLHLLVAAGTPMIAVAAAKMPVLELLQRIAGLVF